MEDRRRRRVAFENLAKEMLRYLYNSDDARVGITELQERVEVPLQFGISEVKMAKRFLKYFGKKKSMYCQLGQMGGAVKRFHRIGKKMSRHRSGNRKLSKRQEIF